MTKKTETSTDSHDLPWPQVWTDMSWNIAQWVACHPDTACVKLVWNEDLLTQQIDSSGFHQATHAMREALEKALGPRLEWLIQRRGDGQPHQLTLSKLTS